MAPPSRIAPRLVAVSGPLKGRSFPLEQAVLTLGRLPECDVPLPVPDVSRRHCELRRDGERCTVRDLGSRHGTFVNGAPVGERALEHSDLVQVGTSAFLFLLNEAPGPEAPAPAPAGLAAHSTVERRLEDTIYLQPGRLRVALSGGAGDDRARIAADLQALLELSTATLELREVGPLADRVLSLLLDVLPADRGAVLLGEPGADEPAQVAARGRSGEVGAALPVDRALLARALEGRVGLLCADLAEEGRPEVGGSGASPRSLLCVPLAGRAKVLGALYFEAEAARAFTEHHLELCTAAAAITALALDGAAEVSRLRAENRRLQSAGLEHGLVGESAAMQRLLRFIERVAPTDSTVLLRGESGTGKELAARAVHRASRRAGGPFIAINCATLSDTLLESELFGHEKGAFTGAAARKTGKLEAADGGTLFLDEVGEIPLPLQARLLRVLQEREFDRVGGTRPIRVDVRLIAATNRDLEAAIREGGFREDLFYRLNVIAFQMPSLRERREDIPLLAHHFIHLHGERLGRRVAGLSPEARQVLSAYDWPGNVRQLGNTIERAIVLGEGDLIRPEDLPDEILSGAAAGPTGEYQTAVVTTKKKLVLDAIEQAGGDYHQAAASLGIHVNSLHRMIRNLGLKAQLSRERTR